MAGTLVIDAVKSGSANPPTFQNTSGVEVGQLCRAWVNFNGSTGSIRASFNVSSVTRRGTGQYTVNLASAMPDALYAITAQSQKGATEDANWGTYAGLSGSVTTSAFNLTTGNPTSNALSDSTNVFAAVFR